MTFPPVPVYPAAIDNDHTLYLVYNTSEARLSSDNSAWSQEIEIQPVAADADEVWALNGFANLDGEMFYYDDVDYNSNGKINKLRRCARNLGGERTKFNPKGSWVRGYVVAEHHNQIVDAVMKTQNFIGRNLDERQETLDWRIRNLQSLDVVFDDYSCPDINFTFNILSNDPVSGILAEYLIEITPPGSISSFRLDFGDGEYTTTALTGQHRYALNARIDPVVRASNDKCQMIQTPIERSNPSEPSSDVSNSFDIPIPEVPEFPDFTFVPCEVPEPDISIPPLVTGCGVTLGDAGFSGIPSIIIGSFVNMASVITVISTNPINITQSVVQIIGGADIPDVILIDPPIPATIIIDPPIPPTIVIVPPASSIMMDLNINDMPRLEVDWGTPPAMEFSMNFAKQVQTPAKFSADPEMVAQFGTEFADLFQMDNTIKVDYESVGFPSEITLVMPSDMTFKLDTSGLDKTIKVDASEVKIPDIKIVTDGLIPTSIKLDSNLPERIEVAWASAPIPDKVEVIQEHPIPEKIVIEIPKPIPEKIILEHNLPEFITLVGPTSIPLSIPEDLFIPVRFPDVMPEMVVKVAPIELKITMDEVLKSAQDGSQKCFMLVPCGN